ncbi:zinc finger MYND domain-containing protein 15 [Pelodytes ibericus]
MNKADCWFQPVVRRGFDWLITLAPVSCDTGEYIENPRQEWIRGHYSLEKDMEFVSGYRDPLLEFSELLYSWYKSYLSDCSRRLGRRSLRDEEQEGVLRGLPSDAACWILHVLPNRDISFQLRDPAQQVSDGFYSEDSLRLDDLEKYINLLDLDGGREDQSSADDLYHIDYLLLVAEEKGSVLGVDFLMDADRDRKKDQHLCGVRAYHLLCQCMARPMGTGPPRRPRRVTVGDPVVHCFLGSLLPTLGIQVQKKPLRDWILNEKFILSSRAVRTCHVCKKRSFEATLTPCARCSAVLYCSEKCKVWDWNKCPADISHEYWCGKMSQYMQSEKELANLPFKFTQEVTSPSFDKERFLSVHHLNGSYWLAESLHYQTYLLLLKRPAWDLDGGRESDQPLPQDMATIFRQNPPDRLTWVEYYKWRDISLNNPVAALLTYPLTIYYVITTMVPQHFPELNILKKQSLKIHIIEARRAYDCVLLFWELAVLMPHVALELVFVGDVLPLEEDEKHFIIQKKESEVVCTDLSFPDRNRQERGIQVKVHSRPYHALQAAKPDLVIGFNSGFGLYDKWLSTLPRLQSLKVPAYFSECSQYSCDMDGQVVAMATGGSASPPIQNPFRSPLRIAANDNCMPWYNNAFLFYLIYKTTRSPSKQRHVPPPPQATPAETPEPAHRKKQQHGGRNNTKKRK